jgi:hypothetical protein
LYTAEEFSGKINESKFKDYESKVQEKEENKIEIVEEEELDVGRVPWAAYKRLFSFATCGMCGMVLIVLISVIINLCTFAVSMYLALTLCHKFYSDGHDEAHID